MVPLNGTKAVSLPDVVTCAVVSCVGGWMATRPSVTLHWQWIWALAHARVAGLALQTQCALPQF